MLANITSAEEGSSEEDKLIKKQDNSATKRKVTFCSTGGSKHNLPMNQMEQLPLHI